MPSLAHDLLGVGQLMTSGYSIVLDGDSFVIHDIKNWSDHSNCPYDTK